MIIPGQRIAVRAFSTPSQLKFLATVPLARNISVNIDFHIRSVRPLSSSQARPFSSRKLDGRSIDYEPAALLSNFQMVVRGTHDRERNHFTRKEKTRDTRRLPLRVCHLHPFHLSSLLSPLALLPLPPCPLPFFPMLSFIYPFLPLPRQRILNVSYYKYIVVNISYPPSNTSPYLETSVVHTRRGNDSHIVPPRKSLCCKSLRCMCRKREL